MKKPVSVSLDEGLLEKIDAKRGELSRSAWIESEIVKGLAGRPIVEPQIVEARAERAQEGRKIDTYPSAPTDPAARRDWTGSRVAGWAPFGEPLATRNAELIAQQKKAAERS